MPRVNDPKKRVENTALALNNRYEGLEIIDRESFEFAVSARAQLTHFLDQVDTVFDPMREKAYSAYKEILDQKKKIAEPAKKLLGNVNSKLSEYVDQQRRESEKQQRKVLDEAQKQAQRDRDRQVRDLRKRGFDEESIEALANAPVEIGALAPVEPGVDTNELSLRETYAGEVVDFYALVKFVAKNKHMIHLLSANSSEINKLARAQKSGMDIPGLRAIRKTNVANRKQ